MQSVNGDFVLLKSDAVVFGADSLTAFIGCAAS